MYHGPQHWKPNLRELLRVWMWSGHNGVDASFVELPNSPPRLRIGVGIVSIAMDMFAEETSGVQMEPPHSNQD